MEKIVIHWSDTFPAGYPQRIAALCNEVNQVKKHILASVLDVYNFSKKQFQSPYALHVVHSARNLSIVRQHYPSAKIVLFLHGQPDTANERSVLKLMQRIDVAYALGSTPDLYFQFGVSLVHFLPFDLNDIPENIETCQSFTSFSPWKGELYNIALNSSSLIEFRFKSRCYQLARGLLRMNGYIHPLRFGSKRLKRKYSSDRHTFLTELSKSRIVCDTDFFDFSFGGNLSITAMEAIGLGKIVLSCISSRNLDKIEEVTQWNVSDYIYQFENKTELFNTIKTEKHINPKNELQKIDYKKLAVASWSRYAPELFDD